LQAEGNGPGAKRTTAWSIFPRGTKYFGASEASFMVNYRVDDLDAFWEELKKAGVEITGGLRGSWIGTGIGLSCGSRQRGCNW